MSSGWKGSQLQSSSDNVLGQTSSYGYDEFNRLISRTANSVKDYTWTYDRYGNRWTQNGAGQNFTAANNRILQGSDCPTATEYCYDAAGNMTSDGFYSYTYDAEGNITAVNSGTIATYVYNALNQRVKTTVGSAVTTEYVFNAGGQRVSEWNGAAHTQLKGKYYWGGKPVAYYIPGAAAHFEHQDWLGTERIRTTYNGVVESTYTSLPWGDGHSTEDGDANHYATLDHDTETDTDHADFRQYANKQGRFLSPDPYSGSYDASNPQSMNRYAYALNNPLSNIDPSGLEDCSALDTMFSDPTDIEEFYIPMGCDGGGGGSGPGSGAAQDAGDGIPTIHIQVWVCAYDSIMCSMWWKSWIMPAGGMPPELNGVDLTSSTYPIQNNFSGAGTASAPNNGSDMKYNIFNCPDGHGNDPCMQTWVQSNCVVSKPWEKVGRGLAVGLPAAALAGGVNDPSGNFWTGAWNATKSKTTTAGAVVAGYATGIFLTAKYTLWGCPSD